MQEKYSKSNGAQQHAARRRASAFSGAQWQRREGAEAIQKSSSGCDYHPAPKLLYPASYIRSCDVQSLLNSVRCIKR